MASYDQLKNLVDKLRDILRNEEGITGMDAMRDICRMMGLKFMEHLIVDEPTDGKIDLQKAEYYDEEALKYIEYCKFSKLAELHGSAQFEAFRNVVHYVFKKHPDTSEIFNDKQISFSKERTLEMIVYEIQKFDFDHANLDVLGGIYEYFLSSLASAKDLGQYFTNRKVIDFIIREIMQDVPPGATNTIYDPCCGTGGFLAQGYKYFKTHTDCDVEVAGNDIQSDTVILGNINMLMTTGTLQKITKRDSLRNQTDDKYDYILTNPPFGLKPKWTELEKTYLTNTVLFEKLFPFKSTSSVELFIESLLPKMNKAMCMIVPFGTEMNGKKTSQITFRKTMMEKYHLYKMVLLPQGIFEYTSIQTTIMFWKPKEPDTVMSLEFKQINPPFILNKRNIHKLINIDHYLESIITVTHDDLVKHGYSLNHKEYTNVAIKYDSSIVLMKMEDIFEFKKGTFNSQDMDATGTIPFYNCGFHNPIGTNSTESYTNKNEYLLLIMSGGSLNNKTGEGVGLGKVFRVKNATSFVSDVTALILKTDVCSIDYLYWYLTINKMKLCEIAKFSTNLGHIGITDLRQFTIPTPTKPVQDMIVTRLKTLQCQIDGFNTVLDNILESNKSYFDLMLLSNLVTKKLSELVKFDKKSSRKASDALEEGEFNFYTSSTVVKKINISDYEKLSIIIGTGGNANVKLDKNFSCSADNIVVNTDDEILTTYIYTYLKTYLDKLQELFTGLAIKHISVDSVKNLEIPIFNAKKTVDIAKKYMQDRSLIVNINKQFINIIQNMNMVFDVLKFPIDE